MKYVTIAKTLAKASTHGLSCALVPVASQNYKAGSSESTARVCLFKNSAAKAAFCPYSRRGRKMLNKLFQVLVLPDSHWPLYTTSLWGRAPGSSRCGDVVRWEVRMTEYLRVAGTVLIARWAGIWRSWCGWRRWRGGREVPVCWVLGWVLSGKALPAHWTRVVLLATISKWKFLELVSISVIIEIQNKV